MNLLDALKFIDKIYGICQDTPEHNVTTENQREEAYRLEEAVSEIDDLCDAFLSQKEVRNLLK